MNCVQDGEEGGEGLEAVDVMFDCCEKKHIQVHSCSLSLGIAINTEHVQACPCQMAEVSLILAGPLSAEHTAGRGFSGSPQL